MQIARSIHSRLVKAARAFSRFRVPDRSAALAYHTIFALIPVLVLVVAVSSFFVPGSVIQEVLSDFFVRTFGEGAAAFFERTVESGGRSDENVFALIFGVLLIFYGAIGFFSTIQRSLFDIFSVSFEKEGAVRSVVYTYVSALLYLVLFLFFIVALFAARIVLVRGLDLIAEILEYSFSEELVRYFTNAVIVLFLSLFFMLTYRLFSHRSISWDSATIGGLSAALLALILTGALDVYFSLSSTFDIYGTAGFLVAMLLWIYFFSIILFTGALISRWAEGFGKEKPAPPEEI